MQQQPDGRAIPALPLWFVVCHCLPLLACFFAGTTTAATATTATATAGPDPQQPFLDWLELRGVTHKLRIAEFPLPGGVEGETYRGVAAATDIAEDEVIVSVPRDLLVVPQTAYDSEIGHVLRETELQIEWVSGQVIPLWLLFERQKGPASKWAPFIRIVESANVDELPIMWSPEQLAQASPAVRRTVEYRMERLIGLYSALFPRLEVQYPALFGGDQRQHYSFALFRRWYGLFRSRHWSLPLEDPEREEDIMVPMADLINFGNVHVTAGFDTDSNAFRVVAGQGFAEGEEVTFWYTGECRDLVAATYGYVPDFVEPCPTTTNETETETGTDEQQALLTGGGDEL